MGILRCVQNSIAAFLGLAGTVLGIVGIALRSWLVRSSTALTTVYGLFTTCEGSVCTPYTYPAVNMTTCSISSALWEQFQVVCQALSICSTASIAIALIFAIILVVTPQESNVSLAALSNDLCGRTGFGGYRKPLRYGVLGLSCLSMISGWSTVAVFAYWYTKGLYCGETPCRAVSPFACQVAFGPGFGLYAIASCAASMLFIISVADVVAFMRGRSTLIRGTASDAADRSSIFYTNPSFMKASIAPPSTRSSMHRPPQAAHSHVIDSTEKDIHHIERDVHPQAGWHQPIFPFEPPAGDWVAAPDITNLFWSESEQLFFDPFSGQFYDPQSEHWFDPEIEEWYRLH